MIRRGYILFFFFTYFSVPVLAQDGNLTEQELTYFSKFQDSLKKIQHQVFHTKSDSLKIFHNKHFLDLWEEVLLNQLSWYFPFDSLKEVGILTSPDQKFRIVHWDINRKDDTHHYFGFIQVKNEKGKYELYKLADRSASIKSPESHQGDAGKWFGMLYYKIIPCDDYYLLLGWDGNDKLTRRKFIDVLSFKDDKTPLFGKEIFKLPQKNPKRIMFEFSAELVMSLKYIEEKKIIVFDHLAPKDPFLEGQYQFYGPDFSYDCFRLSKGKWKYEADVDVKNFKSRNDGITHKKGKEKVIYSPKK